MKPVIFVDIDETLIYARKQVPGSVEFDDEVFGDKGYVIARPSSYDFLETLSKKYDLAGLTSGILGFHEQTLSWAGLRSFLNFGLFGPRDLDRTDIHRPELPENWVLVDNDVAWALSEKTGYLRVGHQELGARLVECESFFGIGDPQPLTELISKIEQLLLTNQE